MARRAEPADETYIDSLRTGYGIEAVALTHRQMLALDECQPCSRRRLGENRSFSNDLTPSVIAYSGIGAFSRIGDRKGALIGLSMPDLTPVYLDRHAASAENKPPAMAIVGEPGGGKTWLVEVVATQFTLDGDTSIVINPKPSDSLAPFAEAVGGHVVSMSQLASAGGAFDPFGYAGPEMAAEIATDHILQVLGRGWTQAQELDLGRGLARGASPAPAASAKRSST